MRADVVILGMGGMGSASAFHLARAGLSVIGLERYAPGHARCGSAGGLRGFRMAYFQDPAYVALAKQAEALWRSLDAEFGGLFSQCGGTLVGPSQHPVIEGVQASSAAHDLAVERLSPQAQAQCLPGLNPPFGSCVLWEPRAGVLDALACDAAHREGARAAGARIFSGLPGVHVSEEEDGMCVHTPKGQVWAQWVILSPGVWFGQESLGLSCPPLQTSRQIQGDFVADSRWEECLWNCAPAGVRHSFYGHSRGDGLVTVGQHLGGRPGLGQEPPDLEEKGRIRDFVRAHLEGLGSPIRWRVGHSIHTPDQAPLIGTHPTHERVLLAGGFSGHGYKFASAVGWNLSQWIQGESDLSALSSFRPQRFTFDARACA